MKEKLKRTNILDKWFYTDSPLVIARPAMKETGICLLHLLSGFLLACGKLFGQASPFPLGFLSAVGGGIRGLCTLIGTVAGFLTMQSFSQGLEMTSAAILIFVAMYIFSGLWVSKQGWFLCLVPGVMSAAIGGIFLFSQEPSLVLVTAFVRNVLLAALSPICFSTLLSGRKQKIGTLIALGCFLLGGHSLSLPFGLTPGNIAAAALLSAAVRHGDLTIAAPLALACGLALDLSQPAQGCWCLLLSAGALGGCGFPRRRPALRLLGMAAAVSAAGLCLGQPMLLTPLVPGILLSLLIPEAAMASRESSSQATALVEGRLEQGARALRALYDAVGKDPEQETAQTLQSVMDKAAGKTCKRCVRYHTCWTKNTQETYGIFHQAMEAISSRGQARAEDFPEEFTLECRQLEGLLAAINREMDALAMNARARSRTDELREILSRSLLHLSGVMEANYRTLHRLQRLPAEAFAVKVGVSATGRGGSRLSGDRGACFSTEDGKYFAILCDGAGTGASAARESLLATETLTGLIQSGMPVASAMELLSGVYILRDEGFFSTMDVVELSLITGQATLYKWGSAPSYVKSGTVLKKIGTAAPPPGLGVGSTFGPEVLRLSLWGGDMLILLSDGALCQDTEDILRRFEGENGKALAGALIDAAAKASGEDDMTAAVLTLQNLGI